MPSHSAATKDSRIATSHTDGEPSAAARALAPLPGKVLNDRALKKVEPETNQIELLEGSQQQSQRVDRTAADSKLRRMLALSDLLAATLTFAAVLELLGGQVAAVTVASAALIVPLNKMLGLYDRDAHVMNKTTLDEAPMLVNAAIMLAFSGAVVHDLTQPAGVSFEARQLFLLAAFTALTLAIGRVMTRRIAGSVVPAERCLVLGGARECEQLAQKLEVTPNVQAKIVARAPVSICGSSQMRDLREVIVSRGIDRVIVVPDERDPEEVSDAIRAIKSIGVKLSLLPRLLEAVGTSVERDEICGVELIGVKDFRMTKSSAMVKRSLDVTIAAAALVLLSPLMLLIALAIKLDSTGPVFYRQRRIGRDGKPFGIFKFRTMIDGADRQKEALRANNETSGLFKIADDPRVTRVGRYLRRSSVDELPQLLNVLLGDMSLVGPRPLVPDEDENITGWYRRRSHITPGITGVWQLHGPVRIPLHEMVKIDYTYVANWSLWADVKILMRTVPHVLGRRGL